MMQQDNKIGYEAPEIKLTIVELEQGIAAASATLSGGNEANPFQPSVEDWKVEGLKEENKDF